MLNRENVVEIWRQYPPIEWLYGSNLGNLKTVDHYTIRKDGRKQFIKGHDLKQFRKPNGYMKTGVSIGGGKMVYFNVHRVIASCFLPNPDGLPQVNHKNCNPSDNRVENLEWCTASYNQQYREKYGVSMTEALGHPLRAYNLETFEEQRFSARREAERELGVNQANIWSVLKGKKPQSNGYYFTEDDSEVTKEKLQSIKDNMHFFGGVIAINLNEQVPLRFKSQQGAARQLKCDRGTISHVISGRQNHTHGYWFTRADENAVENTRAKFGDSVSDKVAKLMAEINYKC
jgi:hypothetical protein